MSRSSKLKRDSPPEDWSSTPPYTIREERVTAVTSRRGITTHTTYAVLASKGNPIGYGLTRDGADTLVGRLSDRHSLPDAYLVREDIVTIATPHQDSCIRMWAVHVNDSTALDNAGMSQLIGYGSSKEMAEALALLLAPPLPLPQDTPVTQHHPRYQQKESTWM